MLTTRLIPVLILRDGRVVQSVKFKHTNVIHYNPANMTKFFNDWEADEIVCLDVSREKNNKFLNVFKALADELFIPLTAGGWIETIDDIRHLLKIGADKIVINTQAFRKPEFITAASKKFGSQCIVVSIDSKDGKVVIDKGREKTDIDTIEWAMQANKLGAGELFINDIDHDGNRQGYNLELMKSIVDSVNCPVIAFGGVFTWQHIVDGYNVGADALAAANIFHYTEHSTIKAKRFMEENNISVR